MKILDIVKKVKKVINWQNIGSWCWIHADGSPTHEMSGARSGKQHDQVGSTAQIIDLQDRGIGNLARSVITEARANGRGGRYGLRVLGDLY